MKTYDYIVVGAGSAGCVLAARLSEDAACSVLLLEAGPPGDAFWIHTPAGMGRLFMDRRFNWSYTTEPVPTLGDRTVYWPRGKVLGGSSAINGMVYMRGHPLDYDYWASQGNDGWGWQDVLPYFRKSERHFAGASALHGGSGPLPVTEPVIKHPSTDDFLEAAVSLGIPSLPELNAPPFEGVAYQQFNIDHGRRVTSYTAFVEPVLQRGNLTVTTSAHVLRVLVEDGEATGVEVLENSGKRAIAAAREVLVCCGALNSPQLLMLSGIGDGGDLQALGIEVLAHRSAVGRHLQDHWNAPFLFETTADSSYNRNLHGLMKYLEGARYLLTRRGYLALGSSAMSAYVRSSPEQPQPDLQLAVRPMSFRVMPDGRAEVDKAPGISAAVVLVGPKSRGHVALKSSDPCEAPAFHPNYLEHPDDLARTLTGIHLMRRIFATEPLANRIVAEKLPGPAVVTGEQLAEHTRVNGGCSWHPVGTCRMGPDEDSVVDGRLRVHGVRRLRVVDASIMPRIISGNTHAPVVMIAEKAADLIKEDNVERRSLTSERTIP